jgi:hypothetical protein
VGTAFNSGSGKKGDGGFDLSGNSRIVNTGSFNLFNLQLIHLGCNCPWSIDDGLIEKPFSR